MDLLKVYAAEKSNRALLTILEDAEIIFLKIGDVLVRGVGNRDRYLFVTRLAA